MNDVRTISDVQTVNVQCVLADYQNLSRVAAHKHKASRQIIAAYFAILFVCSFGATKIVALLLQILDVFHYVTLVALSFPLMFVLFNFASKPLAGLYHKDRFNAKGVFLSPQKLTIDDVGVHVESGIEQSLFRWSGILRIENAKDALLYYVDNMQAIYIPKRCFVTPDEAEAFHRQAQEYWQAAQAQPATGTPA